MSGPLDAIALAAYRTVLPLVSAITDPWSMRTILREMGWAIDLTQVDDVLVGAIPGGSEIVGAIEAVASIAEDLAAGNILAGDAVGTLILETEAVAPKIAALGSFDPAQEIPGLIGPLVDPAFWAELALDLPEYLLLRYLRDYQPMLRSMLRLAGVVVDEDRESPFLIDALRTETQRERIVFDNLTALIERPDDHLRDLYGWHPGQEIDHRALLDAVADLLQRFGFPTRHEPISDSFGPGGDRESYGAGHPSLTSGTQLVAPLLEVIDTQGEVAEFGLLLTPTPSTTAAEADVDSLFLTSHVDVGVDLTEPHQLDDTWTIEARSGLLVPSSVGAVFSPGEPAWFDTAFGVGTDVGFTLSAQPPEPVHLVGGTSGPRLLLHGAAFDIDLYSGTPLELVIAMGTLGDPGLELVIDPGEGDGFVTSLLATTDIAVPFDIGLRWSSVDGFTIDAGTGLAVDIPLGLPVGPIELDTLHLLILAGTTGLSLTAGVSARALLGPISCSVDNIGMIFSLVPPDAGGALQADVRFKSPDGLGIGLDLGVASGGGYLNIDPEAGSYEGVLDLKVLGVGISAVAIIDTQLPDIDGWSMFFALFLDIPSIQLGFGFALNGVGGVAGINRGIDVDALGSAVRSGSLDTILFPEQPIADAPIIIDEFRSIFPAANDSYVFGPIVKIAWGTPALIEAELGIVIQLPDPVVIVVLGSLSAILPTKDVELVALNLDVAGAIDFEAGTLAIDASLHNSHVVGFALSGDMALRAEFGNAQAFLMSVGGFHPRFDPPGDFPDLRRLTFGINAGGLLSLDFQAYFALTSNSVQVGASFTLDASVAGFGVYGHFGFDAMMQFTPFLVSLQVNFEVAITAAGVDLIGIELSGSLDGPNRWHFIGEARFEVLGIGKDIRVDELIGQKENETPISAPDLIGDLVTALESKDAWQILQVDDTAVTLSEQDPIDDALLATPDSTIEVRQQLVPFGLELEQFGNAPVGEYTTFDLTAAKADSAASLEDWFAPGQFLELGKDEKLTGPEFESMRSGLSFGGGDIVVGEGLDSDIGYQPFIIDPEFEEDKPIFTKVGLDAQAGLNLGAASSNGFTAVQDVLVGTFETEYLVVDLDGDVVDRTPTWSQARIISSAGAELHIERTHVEVAA